MYNLMVYTLCLNIASLIVAETALLPNFGGASAFNIVQLENAFGISDWKNKDPSNIFDVIAGYIIFGFNTVINGVLWICLGFPTTLYYLGLPSSGAGYVLAVGLIALFSFVWLIFIVEFITERQAAST